MPVVATSVPIVYDTTKTPKPTKKPSVPKTPKPDISTHPPYISTPELPPGPFAQTHAKFIEKINIKGACFKRNEFQEFSDQDFSDHIEIAKTDKYITQEKDIYCSMQGIARLKDSLDRTTDKREIL